MNWPPKQVNVKKYKTGSIVKKRWKRSIVKTYLHFCPKFPADCAQGDFSPATTPACWNHLDNQQKLTFSKKNIYIQCFYHSLLDLRYNFRGLGMKLDFPTFSAELALNDYKMFFSKEIPMDNKLDNLNMYFTHSPLAFGFWRGLAAIFQSSFVQSLSVIRSDNAINSNKNFPQDTIFMSHKLRLISSPSIATAVLQVYSGFLQIRFLFGQIHLLTKVNIFSNLKF